MTSEPSPPRPPGTIPCIGCRAPVPDVRAETHAYIGASPGCWAVYADVLGREYGEFGFPAIHRLTVDAYAAQHPGKPGRREIQSVAVHLIALHLILDRAVPLAAAITPIRRAVARADRFVWLTPPSFEGSMTILEVARARDLPEHESLVQRWAESVWAAWSAHHGVIREWAGDAAAT